MSPRFSPAVVLIPFFVLAISASAEDKKPLRLLLLAQQPDGHPPTTHEYVAGQKIVARLLRDLPGVKTELIHADGDWSDGPQTLAQADGVVLFASEGAKWLSADPSRRAAFDALAKRGGGLSVLHWGMGTRTAEPIDAFVKLFGACHGGPDRKFIVAEAVLTPVSDSPAAVGLPKFKLRDEFYYRLKRAADDPGLRPALLAKIDGQEEMVAWTYARADGGRSFGLSGLHFHENWKSPHYQKLVAQGVAWTLRQSSPTTDFPAPLAEADFALPAQR